MATITENLETLKTNVARMKEAIGVPPETPLEDITKTVEDNSKTIQAGVYVVEDESELESLTPKEGELAIKYENSLRNLQATEVLTKLFFPDTFTLDTAITTSSYGMYRDPSQTIYRTRAYMTATTFYVMDEYDYIQIVRYTSTDGKTYTKQEAYKDVMEYECPGNQIRQTYTGETYLNGLFVKSVDFKLWRYVEGSWNYADIGCNISEDQIFKPGVAYSSTGKVTGVLDEKQYRNNFLYFQQTEPENKKGVWCKIKTSQLFNHSKYTKDCNTEITDSDLSCANNTFSLIRSSLFRVVPNYGSTAWEYTTCNGGDIVQGLTIYYNGSSTSYTYYGVLLNGKYYAYDSTNRRIYLFDFINNTRTSKASAPSTMSSYTLQDVAYKNNKIYFLTRANSGSSSSGYTCRMFIYDISANTWTNYSLGNPGSAYSSPISVIVTDNNVYYTYRSNSNTELFYIRKLNISSMSLISTISIDRVNDIPDETKRSNFSSSFRLFTSISYNSTGNTIYNPYFSLDLTTFTKDAILEQINSEDYHPGWMSHPYVEGEEYTYLYPYQRYFIGKYNIETREQHVIPYRVSDGETLQCTINFMFRYNNKMYAFKQTGTKLYSLDLNAVTVMPSYDPVIQTGVGGKEVEISEGLTVRLKNVWALNYNGTSVNTVEQIYIGDGKEWKLFRTNS